jgi:hypothetical protein
MLALNTRAPRPENTPCAGNPSIRAANASRMSAHSSARRGKNQAQTRFPTPPQTLPGLPPPPCQELGDTPKTNEIASQPTPFFLIVASFEPLRTKKCRFFIFFSNQSACFASIVKKTMRGHRDVCPRPSGTFCQKKFPRRPRTHPPGTAHLPIGAKTERKGWRTKCASLCLRVIPLERGSSPSHDPMFLHPRVFARTPPAPRFTRRHKATKSLPEISSRNSN